jgi:hypothetical protein
MVSLSTGRCLALALDSALGLFLFCFFGWLVGGIATSAMKTEATRFSETLASTTQSIRRINPKERQETENAFTIIFIAELRHNLATSTSHINYRAIYRSAWNTPEKRTNTERDSVIRHKSALNVKNYSFTNHSNFLHKY